MLAVVLVLFAVLFLYWEWFKEQIQIVMSYDMSFKLWAFFLSHTSAFLFGFAFAVMWCKDTSYYQGYIDGYRLTKAMAARAQLRKKKGVGPPAEEYEKEFEEMMSVGENKKS